MEQKPLATGEFKATSMASVCSVVFGRKEKISKAVRLPQPFNLGLAFWHPE